MLIVEVGNPKKKAKIIGNQIVIEGVKVPKEFILESIKHLEETNKSQQLIGCSNFSLEDGKKLLEAIDNENKN